MRPTRGSSWEVKQEHVAVGASGTIRRRPSGSCGEEEAETGSVIESLLTTTKAVVRGRRAGAGCVGGSARWGCRSLGVLREGQVCLLSCCVGGGLGLPRPTRLLSDILIMWYRFAGGDWTRVTARGRCDHGDTRAEERHSCLGHSGNSSRRLKNQRTMFSVGSSVYTSQSDKFSGIGSRTAAASFCAPVRPVFLFLLF